MLLKYVKGYLPFAIIAALFMIFEVSMDLIQPGIMSSIVDDGILGIGNNGAGSMSVIWQLGIRMIIFALFGGFCGSMNNVFANITAQNIGNKIRKDAFKSIMSLSFSQMDELGTGTLVTRVTNDITQVQNLISSFIRGLIRTSMLLFGSMFLMFRLNIRFGLCVIAASPFIVCCMAICLSRADPLFTKLQSELDRLNAIMQEDVSGIRVIKASVREMYENARFGKANASLIATQLLILTIFAFMHPIVNAIMYLVVAAILVLGSFQVAIGGTTPGDIMAAITYTTQLLNGILGLVMLFQNISRGIASWKRVRSIIETVPDIKSGTVKGSDTAGVVEFRSVSFRYPGTSEYVLKDINLKIEKGECVAIMGATGCGKSTLVNLIPRFYDVSDGALLVDGIDVRDWNEKALRERISIVLQKSEIFSVSIKDNIKWGNMNADDGRVKRSAEIAKASEFIERSENGYDTIVAERGMSLSGGQKQRISLARAVLKNAEILIFDDSTSALDLKTEAEFYTLLGKEDPDSTKIIIAQRIATARHADRIIVLSDGKIAADGTHEELLSSSRIYRDIYDSQMGKGDEDGR